ncbi:MCE-family protein Mce1D [Alloactinosynnema sp. L-07]|uniref:MCE family protein n=1 Tax=Alloactinosynnema sp. L-07 TaxID=1653480 RepID=UPI00065F07D8|nr:MCE family protein [Alloactinosynnema sp. L-07]CRK59553.1 MCE-family protein Mce1D [Alloactinosynnema sp. L-07]
MILRSKLHRDATFAVTLLVVLGLILAGALWWAAKPTSGVSITARFAKAIGVYPGSEVKVLGITVGSVDAVTPRGDHVEVTMTVDDGLPLPPDVSAVAVAPSLVSDRYVQLTPVSDGASLADSTVIPLERTSTPVEIDDLAASVAELADALGPNGANADGALSDAINSAAATLDGNGQLLNDTIHRLSEAANTLSTSSGDLFSTVDNLQKFTRALAESDAQVRGFNTRLASVADYLADDSDDLGIALTALADALGQVHGFIAENKDLLKSNVDRLVGITQTLVDQRGALAEVLDVGPLGASNFLNTYDAATATFAVRGNINELTYPPMALLCRTIAASTPKQLPQLLSDTCAKLAPILDGTVKLPSPNDALNALQRGELPPMPLPLLDLPGQNGPGLTGGGR